MSENTVSHPSPSITLEPNQASLSRRQLLRTLAAGSVALAGLSALTACGGSTDTTNVTLYSSTTWLGWNPMPTKAQQAKDPTVKAYAEVLGSWYQKNPGVTIKSNTANIWSSNDLSNAIAAGTAPTWYPADVLGGWNNLVTRSAFAKGLTADITTVYNSYGTEKKMVPAARPLWHTYAYKGKYYSAPNSFNPGGPMIYYRRDMFQQAGLDEPTETWTWNDVRTMAKALTKGDVKGMAMQSWGIGWPMQDYQFNWMAQVPAPKSAWHWHTDYTSKINDWVESANIYRAMFFQDGSIDSDSTFGDGQVANAFGRGAVAMSCNDFGLMTASPTSPASCAQIAQRAGKPIDEVIGVVRHPQGPHNALSTTTRLLVGQLGFYPRLTATALDKAYNFYDYMFFGDGYVHPRVASYQNTKNLQLVFDELVPISGRTNFPGVPGTLADAWGARFAALVKETAQIPVFPDAGIYFPPEKNIPTKQGWNDAQSTLGYTPNVDTRSVILHAQDVVNQEEASLSSDTSESDFRQAATRYYHDVAQYWQQHSPNFYNNVYLPWYQKYVEPTLQ